MKLSIIRSGKGINATAEYDPKTKRFVVLKGSVVSDTISTAPTFRGAKSIKAYRDKYVENRIVQQDVVFKSSSTAGNFVTGTSTDGPGTWKDKNGKTLKVVLSETKE